MASAAQVKALLQSHGTGDNERFYSVALQVAAAEARRGHEQLAREIQDLVQRARQRQNLRQHTSALVSVAAPQGEAAELLEEAPTSARVSDLILTKPLRERVARILEEQKNLTRLREHGLRLRQRLLFTGPPGCGKTMTASALASELGIPLLVVRLDGLLTRYLGESLNKLRLVFDAVNHARAVYLFDEFDSIGYTREFTNDIGEIRRVLNSFLGFLDKLRSNSLVIAASNHGNRLDKALYRRFDDMIEFGLPNEDEVWTTIQARLKGVPTARLAKPKLLAAAQGLSYAEITRACEEAVKEMLIRETPEISTEMLLNALTERRLFLNH